MATPLPVFLTELTVAAGLVDPLVARSMDKGGDNIRAAARQKVPVRTGSLKRSIRNHGPTIAGGQITVRVTAGGQSTPLYVDYASAVEEGTSRRGPQPYLRPAADKIMPQIIDEIADVAALLVSGQSGRVAGSIRSRTPGGLRETPDRLTGVNPLINPT